MSPNWPVTGGYIRIDLPRCPSSPATPSRLHGLDRKTLARTSVAKSVARNGDCILTPMILSLRLSDDSQNRMESTKSREKRAETLIIQTMMAHCMTLRCVGTTVCRTQTYCIVKNEPLNARSLICRCSEKSMS